MPDSVEEKIDLGLQYHRVGDLRAAESTYRQVLEIDPCQPDAHHLLGVLYHQLGFHDKAVEFIQHAILLKPNSGIYFSNLGMVHQAQGQMEQALADYEQALLLDPQSAAPHHNMASVLQRLGRLDESLVHYEQALRFNPNYAEARWNRSLVLLLQGRFPEAWPDYEWRLRQPGIVPRRLSRPLWDGSELHGRTILVHAEQGFGDTLQFIRYLPMVKQRGGQVILESQPQLFWLLKHALGIDQLAGAGDPPPSDFHVPLLSLPGLFQTTLDTIPAATPYLDVDAELVAAWRRELAPLGGFKVGIAWQGAPTFRWDFQRSIALTQFERLARIAGVHLISLQKGPGSEQLQGIRGRFKVIDFRSRLDEASGPFMDTAAIMKNLDLVISSDTVIPHLAGALGVPVWLALQAVPDWRWLLQRHDSPWYPTMRLFRQVGPPGSADAWDAVFERIAAALQVEVAKHSM